MAKTTLLLLALAAFLALECIGDNNEDSNKLVKRDNGQQIQEQVAALEELIKEQFTELKEQNTELKDQFTVLKLFNYKQIVLAPILKHNNSDGVMIQQRVDGSVDFYRNWDEYVRGFGDPKTNFWLGLETIHELSYSGMKLRVDLWYNNEHKYAEYDNFSIRSASTNYTLHVSGYHGTAGDSLTYPHNGQPFSTKDRDNDGSSHHCAVVCTGAWWYKGCGFSNLNGEYGGNWQKGPYWFDFTAVSSASRVEMKIWI